MLQHESYLRLIKKCKDAQTLIDRQGTRVNGTKNESTKTFDRKINKTNNLLNPKQDKQYNKKNGTHLEDTTIVQNQEHPGKNVDNKSKQNRKLIKKLQVDHISLENITRQSNHLKNVIYDPNIDRPKKRHRMASYKNNTTKTKKNKTTTEKLNEMSNNSAEKWLSNEKKPKDCVKSKQRSHRKKLHSKQPYNETKKKFKNLLNEQIFSNVKSSILPTTEMINKIKHLPFKLDENDLIFMDHKQLVKTLETYSKKSGGDHSTVVPETNKPLTSQSMSKNNTYKSDNVALQLVANCNEIQSIKDKKNKTHNKKYKLKRFKHRTANHQTALSNHSASENINELPLKPITNKNRKQCSASENINNLPLKPKMDKKRKRKHFTINKIRSCKSYKNFSDVKSSYKEPILKYREDLILSGDTNASLKLDEGNSMLIPHCENNRVGNKNNSSRTEHKLSTIYSDALGEEKDSAKQVVAHLNNVSNRSKSFVSERVHRNHHYRYCQTPIIDDPNPTVQISDPLFSKPRKTLQLHLIKSFDGKQLLNRDKKHIDYTNGDVNKREDRRPMKGRGEGNSSNSREDHLMFIYANRESSATSKESLNIAICRDTEITNYGCTNDVLNVIIKQTTGSTSNIETSHCRKLNELELDNHNEPVHFQNVAQDDSSDKALKDTGCQTEQLDLETFCSIGASLDSSMKVESATKNYSINRDMECPVNGQQRFLGVLPNLNHHHLGAYSVIKSQKPEIGTSHDRFSPKMRMLTDESYSSCDKEVKVNEFFTILNSDVDSSRENAKNSLLKKDSRVNKDPCLENKGASELKWRPAGIYDKKGFIKILDSYVDDESKISIKDNCVKNYPKNVKEQELFSELDVYGKLNKVEIKIQDNSNNSVNGKHLINSKSVRNNDLDHERKSEMERIASNNQRFCVILPSVNVKDNHFNGQNNQKNETTIVTTDSCCAVMEKNVSDIGIQTDLESNLLSGTVRLKNDLLTFAAIHCKTNSRNPTQKEMSKENMFSNNKTVNNSKLDVICYNSSSVSGSCNDVALEDLTAHQTIRCTSVIIPIINAVQTYLDKMLKNTLFISSIETCASHNVAQFNTALNGLLQNCIDILQNMEIKECKTEQINTTRYAMSNLFQKKQFINVIKDSELQSNKTRIQLHDSQNDESFKINNFSQNNTRPKPFFVVIPSRENKINMPITNNLNQFKAIQQSKVREQKRTISSLSIISDDVLLKSTQIRVLQENKTNTREEKAFIEKGKTLSSKVNFEKHNDRPNKDDIITPFSLRNKRETMQTCRKQLKYVDTSKSIHSIHSHFNDGGTFQNDTSVNFDTSAVPTCTDVPRGFGDVQIERKTTDNHWNNKAECKCDKHFNRSKLGFSRKIKNSCSNLFDLKRTYNNLRLKPSVSEVHERTCLEKTPSKEHVITFVRNAARKGSTISNSSSSLKPRILHYDMVKYSQDVNDHIVKNHNEPLLNYKLSRPKQADYTKCSETRDIVNKGYSSLKVNKDLPINKLLDEQKCGDSSGFLISSASNEVLNDLENASDFDELEDKVQGWKKIRTESKSQNKNVSGIKGSPRAINNIQTVTRYIESDTDSTNSKIPRYFNHQTNLKKNNMISNLPESTKRHLNTVHLDNTRKLKNKTKKVNNKSIFTVKDIGSESSISSLFSLPKKSILVTNSCLPSCKCNASVETRPKPHNEDATKKIYNIKYSTDQHSVCDVNNTWISLSEVGLQTLNAHKICETDGKRSEENNNIRLQMDVKMNDIMHVEFCCQPSESPYDFPSINK